MRTPDEALAEIMDRVHPLGAVEEVALFAALGRVLADDVVSQVDLPPFQKSAMDGFAVHSADFKGGEETTLRRIGESRAGGPFDGPIARGECVAIYTGARVPADCDAVVMVEKTTSEGDSIRLRDAPGPGQNICNQGEDLSRGTLAMPAHRRLSATDLSVVASVGRDPVRVFKRPVVSILTTGDELVRPGGEPRAGQIFEGNTLHLAALSSRAGADVRSVELVPDEPEALERRFGEALEHSDAVVTTGGVSMGKYDLVAQVFGRLGVREVFHKVAIKPGKPIWFGLHGVKPVFALPGNPVSCLLDHEVFVRPALARMESAGEGEQRPHLRRGRWVGPPPKPNPRQQNLPVTVAQDDEGVEVLTPLKWSSSADIVGLAAADGMAVVPPGESLATGAIVSYRPFQRAR